MINWRIKSAFLIIITVILIYGIFVKIPSYFGTRTNPWYVQPGPETVAQKHFRDANLSTEEIRLIAVTSWFKAQFNRIKLGPFVKELPTCGPGYSNTICDSKPCNQSMGGDVESRATEFLSRPNLRVPPQVQETILAMGSAVPVSDVIILTAASSNHFNEMQAMMQNLHTEVFPKLKNFTSVFVDIGLSPKERDLVKKSCKCIVLSFPFEKFPQHLKELHCYGWKPIIEMAVLPRAKKAVIYQDASLRYKYSDSISRILDRVQETGALTLARPVGAAIAAHTLPETFRFMGENVCEYASRPEIGSGYIALQAGPVMMRAVVEPWVSCALHKECTCPRPPNSVLHCSGKKICHRFDQSSLGIILNKLWGDQFGQVSVPKGVLLVRRGHSAPNYLSSLL